MPEEIRRKHPLAKCEQCPLRVVGRFVPSVGPPKAPVAFVGEAPGGNEVVTGIPFTGPSGKLLNIVIANHDIKREEVFLSNACLCRPPDNATPPQLAIAACHDRLVQELQARGVETVVALGNTAAQSLLGSKVGITKLRVGPGRHSSDGFRVIPTIHPAACLRQSDMFPNLVTDIGKVTLPDSTWQPPAYVVHDTAERATGALRLLRSMDFENLVIDIEVDVEKDIAFEHPNNYGLLSVGLCWTKGKAMVIGEQALKDGGVLDALADLLAAKRIICHNGKFDLEGLYPHVGTLQLWFDTMLAHYVLDERGGVHGLKYLAVELLGAPQYDEEIRRYVTAKAGYGAIPRDKLYRYNAYDVTCTYELFLLFSTRLSRPGRNGGKALRDVHDFLVAASNELMFVELNGITIDRAYLNELTVRYLDVLDGIEKELDHILVGATRGTLPQINPRSPKQVKVAFKALGIPPAFARRPTGERYETTDKDSLISRRERFDIASPQFDFLDTLLKHRREAKLYGTYVKGTRTRLYRGRLYPTFLLHGTTSGRLSCRNPNLQNVPRESAIRRLYVPSAPENVFVQADYAQAELRVLTWLAQEEYFRDVFNSGRDLFDELTPVLYGDVSGWSPASRKELRIRVKAYAYGLSYGREASSVASEFKIPIDEAVRGMNAFFEVIPNIVKFREETRQSVLDGIDLITPFGRRRRFHLITQQNRHDVLNEALAFLPQSTASDICLGAFTVVRPKLRGLAYVRNLMHDALLVETHRDNAEQVGQILSETMVHQAYDLVGDYIPFKADVTTGRSWGDV